MVNVNLESQCANPDYKLIYSFVVGNENSLGGSWRIYKCSSCEELKLVTNED